MEYLTLAEVQTAELNLLCEVVDFFDAHDIDYSLAYGTLIGAIRHKGFIPWDDDVDVFITREDYKKLCHAKKELPEDLFIVDWNCQGYPHHWIKICSKQYRAQEPYFDEHLEEYLWVDVFILDSVDKSGLTKWQSFKLGMYQKLTFAPHVDTKGMSAPKRLMWNVLKAIDKRHEAYFHERYEHYMTSISPTGKYYKCLSTASSTIPKEEFDYKILVPFEGREFKAMSCYDYDLTSFYGDYMQLPAEKDRQTHNLKVWKVN